MVPPQHVELSFEMAESVPLTAKLVLDRKRKSIGIEEYFAGIYLAHREALLPFWLESKRLDLFARDSCGLTAPPWFYWIDFYMTLKNEAKWRNRMLIVPRAPILNLILREAERVAFESGSKSSPKPELGVEHFIVALVAHPELAFTRKMLASGMKRQPVRQRRLRSKPGG